MHGLSVLAKNTPRPNLMWWRGDVMLMFGREIAFTQYCQRTYKQFLELESLILNQVLHNFYTMEEAETVFGIKNLKDHGDEKTPGYGVVADTSNPLMRTAESDKLFSRMFEAKKLDWSRMVEVDLISTKYKG